MAKTMPPPQPEAGPPPTCGDERCAEIARQLTLSRTQAADLHRELAHARKQSPRSPVDASREEHLRGELAHLRQAYTLLRLRHAEAQQEIARLTWDLAFAHKALGWVPDRVALLQEEGTVVEQVLRTLLTLAHPDKWSHGQPATELAHELAVAINAQRAKLG